VSTFFGIRQQAGGVMDPYGDGSGRVSNLVSPYGEPTTSSPEAEQRLASTLAAIAELKARIQTHQPRACAALEGMERMLRDSPHAFAAHLDVLARVEREVRFYQQMYAGAIERRSVECRAEIRATNSSRTASFRASTPALDRHGSIIKPEGIDTTNFEKNPLLLWAHDGYGGWFSTPSLDSIIGRVIEIRKSPEALDIKAEFLTGDINPEAEKALRMVRAKALNSVSIGFIPREIVYEVGPGNKEVPVITKSELLEVSLVPIPSNPEALATERSHQIAAA